MEHTLEAQEAIDAVIDAFGEAIYDGTWREMFCALVEARAADLRQ